MKRLSLSSRTNWKDIDTMGVVKKNNVFYITPNPTRKGLGVAFLHNKNEDNNT